MPIASISTPDDSNYVRGMLNINGYATGDKFTHYTVGLRSSHLDTLLIDSDIKKENYQLYLLDTRSFPDGYYILGLTVYNDRGYSRMDSVGFIIDNTHPVAEISSPQTGEIETGRVDIRR